MEWTSNSVMSLFWGIEYEYSNIWRKRTRISDCDWDEYKRKKGEV